MVDQRLAGRAQQHPGQPAVSPAADHQQLCVGGVCTATRSAARSDASSKAIASADSLAGEPSTPTTTGPWAGGASSDLGPRITAPGQWPCATRATAVEPTRMPVETTHPPGTEHDQPGVAGLLDQRRHRISGLQLDVDIQFGVCLVYRRLGLAQQLPAIGFQRVEETLG